MSAVSAAEVVVVVAAAAAAAAVVQTADEPLISEARVQPAGDRPAEVRDLLHGFVNLPWHRSHLAAPTLDHHRQPAERPGARVVAEAAAAAAADLAERGRHRHHCWNLSPASSISSIYAASKLAWQCRNQY